MQKITLCKVRFDLREVRLNWTSKNWGKHRQLRKLEFRKCKSFLSFPMFGSISPCIKSTSMDLCEVRFNELPMCLFTPWYFTIVTLKHYNTKKYVQWTLARLTSNQFWRTCDLKYWGTCHLNIYRPKRSFGQGNIFTSVCQEFCPQGGGYLTRNPPQDPAGTPPGPGRYTPRDQTPPGPDTPPDQAGSPPGPDPPGPGRYPPPPGTADFGIRSMFGQYASYWNVFLLKNCNAIWNFDGRVTHIFVHITLFLWEVISV